MTAKINQITKKGDPVVRVNLPEIIIAMLKGAAKQNKRRTQDQFIKVLAESFKNEAAFAAASKKFILDLKTVYQSHS